LGFKRTNAIVATRSIAAGIDQTPTDQEDSRIWGTFEEDALRQRGGITVLNNNHAGRSFLEAGFRCPYRSCEACFGDLSGSGHCALCMPLWLYERRSPGVYSTYLAESSVYVS
jgi:hypothetical protein